MSLRDAALILAGHGSTLNADSSAPTYQHAEELRRRNIFAEVHVAFWKEEPNFRQALRQTNRRQVYVVPNFISSGYFTEQVIPRELGLTGPVTLVDGHEVFYCDPVGQHPEMIEVLLRRAYQAVVNSPETIAEPHRTACVFICGHGTSLNDNSTKIIYEQAAAIRERNLYADCQPVLMEQQPFVKDWRTLTNCPDVIVVPFFISDGLHSFEDIPILLGLTPNVHQQPYTVPYHENGRRIWYGKSVGTDPTTADAIMAQVWQFQNEHAETRTMGEIFCEGLPTRDELSDLTYDTPPPWHIGQIALTRADDHCYHVRHRDDIGCDRLSLRVLASLDDLRELIRTDEAGNFRPLRAAPNLRRGWLLQVPDLYSLQLALDYLYPSGLANWALWKQGSLALTPWSVTAERQTGRFHIVHQIGDDGVRELAAQVCDPGCLKKRLWFPAAQQVELAAPEIPLLCPEACNYFVSKARETLKGPE